MFLVLFIRKNASLVMLNLGHTLESPGKLLKILILALPPSLRGFD